MARLQPSHVRSYCSKRRSVLLYFCFVFSDALLIVLSAFLSLQVLVVPGVFFFFLFFFFFLASLSGIRVYSYCQIMKV